MRQAAGHLHTFIVRWPDGQMTFKEYPQTTKHKAFGYLKAAIAGHAKRHGGAPTISYNGAPLTSTDAALLAV